MWATWIYRFFKWSSDLTLVTWSKDHVWKPLTLSQYLPWFGVNTSSAGRDMYFTCHMTSQDTYSVIHIYGWWLLAACQHPEKFGNHWHSDSKRKKYFIKNMNLINTYCQWKIELTGAKKKTREKTSQPQKYIFWEKLPKNLKDISPPVTTFYKVAFEIKTSWAKNAVKPTHFGNIRCQWCCVYLVYSFSNKKIIIIYNKKLK